MSFLKRLFGGGSGGAAAPDAQVVEHEGFRITPEPMKADGQFRIAAWIEGEVDGETKRHHLIRADLLRDRDEASEASVAKARQMIDQMGAGLFD